MYGAYYIVMDQDHGEGSKNDLVHNAKKWQNV
jgi:hypothetical protein